MSHCSNSLTAVLFLNVMFEDYFISAASCLYEHFLMSKEAYNYLILQSRTSWCFINILVNNIFHNQFPVQNFSFYAMLHHIIPPRIFFFSVVETHSHSHPSVVLSAKTLKLWSFIAVSKCRKTGSQNAKVRLYEPVNVFGSSQGSNIRNPGRGKSGEDLLSLGMMRGMWSSSLLGKKWAVMWCPL